MTIDTTNRAGVVDRDTQVTHEAIPYKIILYKTLVTVIRVQQDT